MPTLDVDKPTHRVNVYFHSFGYGGYKVPIRAGDYFTVWVDHQQCIELDAAVVLDLIASRIRDARIVGAIAEQINDVFRERLRVTAPAQLPPAKMPSLKERRREIRKSRKRA